MISLLDQYLQKTKISYTPAQRNNLRQDSYRTNVRAFKPTGHIIKTNPLSLRNAIDSDKRSVKYFKDGINGHGNDYSIGKINDLTIKLGSLGIAGLIATSKVSTLQKSMEFVGLASWLGAMSLWPKLAINAPIKMLKGVDLNTEYKTAAGHRKSFYQDPQYICWDMISDDEMNKLADKLNIPKNIQNRRKATENKARQIAIQGNTLSLLTAGVATPLIASLGADQLGKHVLAPLLQKYQEIRAENIQNNFSNNLKENLIDYKLDANADAIIEKHVKPNMDKKDREAIIKFFKKNNIDHTLDNVTNSTLTDILKFTDVDSYQIPVTKELKKKLSDLIVLDMPNKTYTPEQLINELCEQCNNTINKENIDNFMGILETAVEEKFSKNITKENRNKISESIRQFLQNNQVSNLKSIESTKETLKQMALMAQVYNRQYVKEFRDKYLKYTINSEVSPHSQIWKKMPKKLMKILNLSSSELNELLTFSADPSMGNKILYNALDRIISDPVKYEKAMKELGKFAKQMNVVNDKYLPKALDYIDELTDMFAKIPYKSELDDFANEIKVLLRSERINVLTKYIGTDVSLYAPIRTLAVLKNTKEKLTKIANKSNIAPDKLFDAVKKVMFEYQTTNAFINKLNPLKELLHSEEDYNNVINIVFKKLPDEAEKLMPKGLSTRINDTTTMLKGLLLNLSDDVIFKFEPVNNNEVLRATKNLKFYEYINDLFFTKFNNEDAIISNIMTTIKNNPEKSDMLQQIFRLSAENLELVKRGDKTPIKNTTYFQSALYKARDMFMLFGTNNIEECGGISISKTKMCQSNEAMGQTILNMIKNGQEIANNKSWLKKVGIAFIALAGLTAYAISQIGKKNEFNKDKYIERSKA